MLRWRLLLGTLLIAGLVLLCWLDHHAPVHGMWLLPVGMGVSLLASREVMRLMSAVHMKPLAATVYCGNLLLLAITWMPAAISGNPAATGAWPLVGVGGGLLAAFAWEIYRFEHPGGALVNLAATVFALVYVGLMLSLLVQLRLVWGVGALAAMLLVVKMGDTGAFTVGHLVGRHKLAPVLSPGKTVEGAIGALVFASAASWAAFTWIVPVAVPGTVKPGPPWGWLLFGLLVGTIGIVGDLAESLLKRDAGQKDSGHLLPGFGGMLDLIDSVLLAAPVAWLCWALGWVGR